MSLLIKFGYAIIYVKANVSLSSQQQIVEIVGLNIKVKIFFVMRSLSSKVEFKIQCTLYTIYEEVNSAANDKGYM